MLIICILYKEKNTQLVQRNSLLCPDFSMEFSRTPQELPQAVHMPLVFYILSSETYFMLDSTVSE